MNLTTGENIWTLGGPDGMFAIRDEDNVEWPAGSSLWVGQHNAEFFGEDEYCMFDNQYNTGNNSRMLCVVLDEERGAAHLSWEKKLDAPAENCPFPQALPGRRWQKKRRFAGPEKGLSTSKRQAHVKREAARRLRRCCGGNGYLLSSGIAALQPDYVWWVTAEGDTVVLQLQLARFLVKALKAARKSGGNGVPARVPGTLAAAASD